MIGNGAYRNGISYLANPPRDARAIARVLARLGFPVSLLIDADALEMRAAVHGLGELAQGKNAALLFYAGHAAEVGGRNLLFQSPSRLIQSAQRLAKAIAYDEIATALIRKARTTLIFFDSYRDNPFMGISI